MNARTVWIVTLASAVSLTACGCAARPGLAGPHPFALTPGPEVVAVRNAPQPGPRPAVVLAGHRETASPAPTPTPLSAELPPPRLFDGVANLTEANVIRAVLERNPTIDQMRATAAAVAARYPQVTSLDDPNLGFSTAPGSAWSPNASYAARVEFSQKIPYAGKRGLRGAAVRAETAAAEEEVEDVRLELAEAARSALADYLLAVKAAGVAEENAKLLREFRRNAETRYRAGQGQQQDVLQAEVELARQEERAIALRRARLVAVARLNTLMHLAPDAPLPPPAEADTSPPLPEPARLREAAGGRPDVRAAAARVAAGEAALDLALREYKPDVEVLGAYDGFWQGAGGRPLQWQLGVRTNLPVRYARRDAAVEEARANIARRRAELARLTDRINYEVQEAFERLREAEAVVRLYEAKALPAAEANVKEAQAAYTNNKVPFLNLIEAQRGQTALKDRFYEAQAEVARRRAALDRAVGIEFRIR